MKKHFTKNIQIANRHMKRCSTSLAVREVQIKTTMRYLHMPIKMAKIKNNDNTNCCQECEETCSLIWWECKMVEPLWKTAW